MGVKKLLDRTNWYGIDFGTTNSAAVSYTGLSAEKAVSKNYGDGVGRPIPSIVAINRESGEVIVGREVKDKRNEFNKIYEVFTSIKSIIDSDERWNIAGKIWTPVDVASELFKELKSKVEKDGNKIFDEAVVAVPIGFSSEKKECLRKAAKIAEIDIKMFISEPTAAFCSRYEEMKGYKYVAVFDWGGGTLDVAILHIENGRIFEMSTEGMQVAGNDIDIKLAEKMHANFMRGKEHQISFEELDIQTKDTLILKCEDVKCEFSAEDSVRISINKYDIFGPVQDVIQYNYFSLLVEKEVDQALECLERAILKAGLNKSNIDCILCVGGSSKLRPLQEKMSELYGEDIVVFPRKAMWDIADGAANISSKPGCYALSKSIGMLLSDGSYFPLLEKGQNIPCDEFNITLGKVDTDNEARFVFTDANRDDERTFVQYVSLPTRQFYDEKLRISCYIDPNFIFKVKLSSNRMLEQAAEVWEYEKVKIYYNIEGE